MTTTTYPLGTTHTRLHEGKTLFYRASDPTPTSGMNIRILALWVGEAWEVQTGWLPWRELVPVEPPTSLTWPERIENYKLETGFPEALFLGADGRVVGTWIMGNDYRVKSTYYGGYPASYLRRIKSLFPDKRNVLHLFSGKVDTVLFPGKTVDINAEHNPDYVDDAQRLTNVPLEEFDLVMADPPYSVEDCDHYQTTMIKRNVVMKTLGERLKPGAHVVWLDQVLPMFRKDQFSMEAVIGMVKSTNHRFRVIVIFKKLSILERNPHEQRSYPC